MKKVAGVFFFLLMSGITFSDQAQEVWVARYGGSTASENSVRAMTIDQAGNVYVAGSSARMGGDFLTIKYSQK